MKKIVFILLILILVSSFSWAGSFNLGDFPIGKWLDSRWNALWEFKSDNIRILNSETGDLFYDFDGKTIENFSVKPSLKGIVLSFYCRETGKRYTFTKGATNLNLDMLINTDTGNTYEVNLPFKK